MPAETMDEFSARPKQSNVLVFGAPKTGKTRSGVTLLTMFRDVFKKPRPRLRLYDFDDGADSLVNAARAAGFSGDNIVIYRYRPPGGDKISDQVNRARGQGRDIYLQFIKDFNTLIDGIDIAKGVWKPTFTDAPDAIMIDSATTLQSVILDFVLCMVGHELGAPGTDARSDFGKAMQKTVECVQACRTLPCVSVWTAHESLDKNELTSEIRIDPYFTGKLAATIAAEFSVVLYSTTRPKGQEMEYVWYTKPQGFVKTSGTRHKEGLTREVPQDFKLVL